MAGRLKIQFWGVRGSTPTPERRNSGFGGNTPCVEVRGPGGELIILDAGTGIRSLGRAIEAEREIHLFITHFHWDHIQGLPYFNPLFDPRTTIRIYTGWDVAYARDALASQMKPPHHPIALGAVASNWDVVALDRRGVRIGNTEVRPFEMFHPQGAFGYRIDAAGASMVYATDRELCNGYLDDAAIDISRDTDILIHDSQYLTEEYSSKEGWGHCTWADAAAVAEKAGAKRLFLFHHDPSRDDAGVEAMVNQARCQFPSTEGAREGSIVEI